MVMSVAARNAEIVEVHKLEGRRNKNVYRVDVVERMAGERC